MLNPNFLSGVLSQAKDRYHVRYRQEMDRYVHAYEVLQNYSFGGVQAKTLKLGGYVAIQRTRDVAEERATSNTLFGYSSAVTQLLEGFRLFQYCFEEYKGEVVRHHQNEIDREERAIHNPSHIDPNRFSETWAVAGGVSGGGYFLYQLFFGPSFIWPLPSIIVDGFKGILIGGIVAAGVALFAYVYRKNAQATNMAAVTTSNSARREFNILKTSLLKDISIVRDMSLPKECGSSLARPSEVPVNDVQVGRVYEGKVARLMDFGAFVTILPGRDGPLHISQISEERIERVGDKLKEGDVVRVKVLEVDREGRVRLSMRNVNAA